MMTVPTLARENRSSHSRKFWLHGVVLALLPLLLCFQIMVAIVAVPLALRGRDDFRQLYVGGYMIRTGHAAELYDYDTQKSFEETVVPSVEQPMLPINHVAFEELLFVPLSRFTYRVAYWIFLAFNCALLILCAELLRRRPEAQPQQWKWSPAVLILAFFPISRALEKGQDSIIMLTLLAAALWALDHDKEFAAGLLVGIGIFKFQIVIPIALLYLIWRHWRFFKGFAFSSVAAGVVSLWLVGLGGARNYARMLLSMSVRLTSEADMRRYATHPRDMINLRGLVSGIFDSNLSHGSVQFLVGACSIVVLFAAAKRRASLPLAITAASLVSYHFIIHDASILIIPLNAALSSRSVWNGAVAALLLVACTAAVIPQYGYLAAIPLLALFVLSVGLAPKETEAWQTLAN